MNVEGLINIEKYPIADLSTVAAQALVARCQTELQATGKCSLSRFLRPETAATLAAEVKPALEDPYVQVMRHNIYRYFLAAKLDGDIP